MAIRPRGNAFQADATVSGVRVRRDFGTELEAQAWIAEVALEKARAKVKPTAPCPNAPPSETSTGPLNPPKRDDMRTFAQAVDRTFARYYAGKPSEKKLRLQADRLIAFWGKEAPLASIDHDALDNLIAHFKKANMAGGTINRYLAVVSKVMTFAASRGSFVRPKIEREPEFAGRLRWLSREEETNLLNVLRQWGKDEQANVVTVLLDTGMRSGELFQLEARDVDTKTGAIHIWRNKTELPRTVYMTPRVKAIMEPLVDAKGPVFPRDNFWLRAAWDRARAHLGFTDDPGFIPYVCRHTCASRLIQRGVALPVVKDWLGHKSIQMTMRYAHLAPKNLQEAANALAQGDD